MSDDILSLTDRTASLLKASPKAEGFQPSPSGTLTLEEIVSRSTWMWRFFARLFRTFAGLALTLAAVGIHGALAYTVSRRTREIGVRIALGAGRRRVLALVFAQGARLVFWGIVIGLPLSLLLGKAASSHLYGVSWFESSTTAPVLLLLAGVGAFSICLPARRAARVNPVTALRYE